VERSGPLADRGTSRKGEPSSTTFNKEKKKKRGSLAIGGVGGGRRNKYRFSQPSSNVVCRKMTKVVHTQ